MRARPTPLLPLAPLLALLLAAGCDDSRSGTDAGGGGGSDGGAGGPHATLSWQMRCDTDPCPATPSPARTLDASDGEGGAVVSCDVSVVDGERLMDLTARQGSAYGIEVRGARIGLEGGRILGSFCQIRVFEETDVTVFEPCSSSSPTADRACQIQRIDIRDVEGVPTLSGELRCVDAGVEGDAVRVRDVTAASAASGYATFAFTGCVGL